MDLFLSLYDVWKVVIAPAISWLFTHIFNWDNISTLHRNPPTFFIGRQSKVQDTYEQFIEKLKQQYYIINPYNIDS